MAKLTFYQRYISDTRFKKRADGLLMESIYAQAGIDAEGLCRRWEEGDRELKLEDVATKLNAEEEAPAKPKTPTRRKAAPKKKQPDAAAGDD